MQALVGISSSFSCPHSGQRRREVKISSAIKESSNQQYCTDGDPYGGQNPIG
jgi:hypothetical protein